MGFLSPDASYRGTLPIEEIRCFLDEKYRKYNTIRFIEDDPIQIPRSFTLKEDIEIAGFLSAVIAWGQRKTIITNAQKMMQMMDHAPYDFIKNHTKNDLSSLEKFTHRTFQLVDFTEFIRCLTHIYQHHGGLETAFQRSIVNNNLQLGIAHFKKLFFEKSMQSRTWKHLPDPTKGSAAKRINMFLRWMVRKDENQVDLGIWNSILPSQLSCPLDVHTGNVGRKLGFIHRKQNDAKAVAELDFHLRLLDKEDPVKYDFALFGLGVFEKF